MKTLLFAAIAAINTSVNAGHDNTSVKKAAYGEADNVRTIIARGTDLNAHGRIGNTALIYAVQEGHTEIAEMLVAAGANPDASNDYGNTARTLVESYGQREIVKVFDTTPVKNSPSLLVAIF
jgi:uncharacterized protein